MTRRTIFLLRLLYCSYRSPLVVDDRLLRGVIYLAILGGLGFGMLISQTSPALTLDKMTPYYFQNNMSNYSCIVEVLVYNPPKGGRPVANYFQRLLLQLKKV